MVNEHIMIVYTTDMSIPRISIFYQRLGLTIVICLIMLTGSGVQGQNEEENDRNSSFSDQPSISLITVVNNENKRGGHSSLIIRASEKVIFDPAGRIRSKYIKEKGDVLYGINNEIEKIYLSIHARESYHVVKQTSFVSMTIAEQALTLAKNNGPVGPALCARAISLLLKKLPGFESISVTYFPEKLMSEFALRDDVVTQKIFEFDDQDKNKALKKFEQDFGK